MNEKKESDNCSTVVNWKETSRLAQHWHSLNDSDGSVICTLNPRMCKIKPGQFGFCGVRGNIDGSLHTFNYGKSVAGTKEIIETEAVNQYAPGAAILSLGNIGCMMHCDFCQNWETSQVKHLNPAVVKFYTPQQVINTCKNHQIDIISWTYNDPVVWHEFVVETSKLAKKNGIKTLYKSAFYIEEKPVSELIECIDIFSISLKSLDPVFYRKITGAKLEPVLERIKQVHKSGKHLEISQLIVTGRNDTEEEIQKTINWVTENLGHSIPLHFVAFHPAYRYMSVERTPKSILLKARENALKAGIKHCYIGNIYENHMADSKCPSCGNIIVSRFGLSSKVVGADSNGRCSSCGSDPEIKEIFLGNKSRNVNDKFNPTNRLDQLWEDEAQAVHLQLINIPGEHEVCKIRVFRDGRGEVESHTIDSLLNRIIISKISSDEKGITIEWDNNAEIKIFPVLDRAHFPVLEDLRMNLLGVNERLDIINNTARVKC